MRAAILAVALALAGCAMPHEDRGAFAREIHEGAARRRIPVDAVADLFFIDGIGFPHPALGITTRTPTGPCRVEFSKVLEYDETMARNVSAHELGHVLGCEHGNDRACWMYPTQDIGRPLIEAPSPDELAVARECPVDFVVDGAGLSPALYEALRWGAGAWNRALGRAAFEVRR